MLAATADAIGGYRLFALQMAPSEGGQGEVATGLLLRSWICFAFQTLVPLVVPVPWIAA